MVCVCVCVYVERAGVLNREKSTKKTKTQAEERAKREKNAVAQQGT